MTKAQAMGGICTVSISPAIFVQGAFVAARPDGRIVVRVGDRDFLGQPISTTQSTGATGAPLTAKLGARMNDRQISLA